MGKKIVKVVDSLKERQEDLRYPDDALDVLQHAQQCWYNWRSIREERKRCFNYTYGDQWSDLMETEDERGRKRYVTEGQYLRSIGQTPLQNNLIRRLVRTVLGVYRSQLKEPTCVARDRDEQSLGDVMSTVLQCNWQRNRMKELNARTMEEFLVGGVIVHRKSYGLRNGSCDCWTDYVNPSYFFVDSVMRDFRTWDTSLVGEIHDISFQELVTTFGKTADDYKMLKEEYDMAYDSRYYGARYDRFFGTYKVNDFLIPSDPAICRVFEIWTKENKSRYHCHDYNDGTDFKIDTEDYEGEVIQENKKRKAMALGAGVPKDRVEQAQRFVDYFSEFGCPPEDVRMPEECRLVCATPFIDSYWYYRYLTPRGLVLREGETPFKHEGHPYVFRMYPFLNGEVHSFVSDIIDQQRHINRIISQIDMIARASAKGLLMVPRSSLGGKSEAQIAKVWSKPNGVYVYEDNNGRTAAPQQINAGSNTASLENMLVTQQKILEDASGVHGAVQGKQGASSVSGVLYNQQAQNSTMTLLDLLDTFSGFEEECALMDVKNIQQFYDEVKTVNIVGSSSDAVVYDPRKIKDIEFDIAIGESTATPAYRQLAQDYYNQWLASGMIDIEQALEFGNFPNGDALLQDIRTKREQQEQAQQEQAMAQQQQGQGQQVMSGEQSGGETPPDPTTVQPDVRPEYMGQQNLMFTAGGGNA